jgi:lysophospholipase L1-like esterase
MAVAVRGFSSPGASFNATTRAIAVPTGTVTGDVLYAFININTGQAITAFPAQFVQLATINGGYGPTTLYRRVVQAGDPTSYNFTANGSGTWYGSLLSLSGVDNVTPEDTAVKQAVIGAVGAAGTVTFPATDVASVSGVGLVSFWGGAILAATTFAPVSGSTVYGRATENVTFKSQSGYGPNTGTQSGTTSAAEVYGTVVFQVAVRPAGAVQYAFAPAAATPASAPLRGGLNVLNAAGTALVPAAKLTAIPGAGSYLTTVPNVMSRCKHYSTSQVATNLNSRSRHVGMFDGQDVRMVFGNVTGIEVTTGLGTIVVTASLELPSAGGTAHGDGSQDSGAGSQFFQVTWNGQPSVTIAPGQYAPKSDAMPVTIYKGKVYFIRTYVTCASGAITAQAANPTSGPGGYEASNTTAADQTMSGAANGTTGAVYGPQLVEATPAQRYPQLPYVVLIGDSIMDGVSRGVFSWADQVLEAARIPYNKLSMSGEQAIQFLNIRGLINTDNGHIYRGRFIGGATDVVNGYCVNDFAGGGATAAQMQQRVLSLATYAASYGARFHTTTCTPKSGSTDSWVTAVNQTPNMAAASETARIFYNTWLRDGAPTIAGAAVAAGSNAANTLRAGAVGHPFAGVIDVAATVEVSNGAGGIVWQPSAITTDGLHPGDSGHNLMAGAFATYVANHFAPLA